MRASINWLKDYVDFNETPEQLAEMMTMAGLEVDAIEYLGQAIENVTTGKLLSVAPHPNADRLLVCKVDIGQEKLTIVTGATNISAGDIVPVALVGAKLPNGAEIGQANFRGIDSQGMLCSPDELVTDTKVLPPEAKEGIWIMAPDTPIGVDPRPLLGLDDVVLEVGLTPNRADCFSMIGLAREVAALTGGHLKKPMLSLREEGEGKAGALAKVTIEERELCPRFTARIFKDIKIAPSPLWLQHRIQAAGMRPINNVVDVTNFVMLEMGQPMHAYDYSLLAKHSLIVRRANPGERLTTLDGVKRELSPDMLVVADAVQAVGIAGVMGGLATEVTAQTQTVLLEAAAFNGPSIRRTSRALGLRSEASGRYERGIDTANTIRALDRAAGLLERIGACKVCEGIIDEYPNVHLPRQVTFLPDDINAYLGVEIPAARMVEILRKLEFEVEQKDQKVSVTVPTWRGDVTRAADISEEIARVFGYNNIPATLPFGQVVRGEQRLQTTIADYAKNVLCGAGFSEILSYSFTHPSLFDKLGVSAESDLRKAIPILNPITEDFQIMRTTLMGGVLQALALNLSRKNDDLKLFELSSVYIPASLPLADLPEEPLKLCGALLGRRQEIAWNQSNELVDFYDAKGAVEELLTALGIEDYEVVAGEYLAMHPGKTALFRKDDQLLGAAGEVHPAVLEAFGINKKVFLFELDFELLVKLALLTKRYQALPRFPAIARDLAVVLPAEIPAAVVAAAIRGNGGELLAEVRLFDVYTGEPVPAGFRSLAFALVFRSPDRTLTDEEVEQHHRSILNALESRFGAKLRL